MAEDHGQSLAFASSRFDLLILTKIYCLQVYFSSGCLRSSASTCLNTSNVYYPMTNHGLNLLTYYYMDQADLLTDDEDVDVTEANSRYGFIQAVRLIPDLQTDLQTPAHMYNQIHG